MHFKNVFTVQFSFQQSFQKRERSYSSSIAYLIPERAVVEGVCKAFIIMQLGSSLRLKVKILIF
jgi:hypothetical protein